jgi:Skp family chaperone for outer membrane proteins
MAKQKTVHIKIVDIERILSNYELNGEDKQVMNDILSYFKHNVNDKQNILVEMDGVMFNDYINKLK